MFQILRRYLSLKVHIRRKEVEEIIITRFRMMAYLFFSY